jgi:hypothetical protein
LARFTCEIKQVPALTFYTSNSTENIFSHGQHLSMGLCHDENQKDKITHEKRQKRKGTAQKHKCMING